jgi:hypothetical protein
MSAIIGATKTRACGSHGNHPDSEPDWPTEGLGGGGATRAGESHTHTHTHTHTLGEGTATNG